MRYAVAEKVTLKRLIRQLTEKSFKRRPVTSKRTLQGPSGRLKVL